MTSNPSDNNIFTLFEKNPCNEFENNILMDRLYSIKIIQECDFAKDMKDTYGDDDLYHKMKIIVNRDYKIIKDKDVKKQIFQEYHEFFEHGCSIKKTKYLNSYSPK